MGVLFILLESGFQLIFWITVVLSMSPHQRFHKNCFPLELTLGCTGFWIKYK